MDPFEKNAAAPTPSESPKSLYLALPGVKRLSASSKSKLLTASPATHPNKDAA